MNFTLIYAKVDLLVRNFDDNILLFWQLFLITQTYYIYHIISQFSYTKIELCWYQHSDLKYAWIIIILIKMLRHTYLIRYIKVRPHFGYSRPPPTVCAFVVCIPSRPHLLISGSHQAIFLGDLLPSGVFFVHLLSTVRAMCPAHFHFRRCACWRLSINFNVLCRMSELFCFYELDAQDAPLHSTLLKIQVCALRQTRQETRIQYFFS